MIKYTEITTISGLNAIQAETDDGQVWGIPIDSANSDYQAYLATLAANSAPTAQ